MESLEEVKVRLPLSRVTKGTVLYQKSGNSEVIQNIYVKKEAFKDKYPKEITVTVTWDNKA